MLHYAFYADSWSGPVELRGLEEADYRVIDYVGDAELGTVSGPTAELDVAFQGFLLVEARPE